jgi:hypothetical protein
VEDGVRPGRRRDQIPSLVDDALLNLVRSGICQDALSTTTDREIIASEGVGSTPKPVADRQDFVVWVEFHHECLPALERITQRRGVLPGHLASLRRLFGFPGSHYV